MSRCLLSSDPGGCLLIRTVLLLAAEMTWRAPSDSRRADSPGSSQVRLSVPLLVESGTHQAPLDEPNLPRRPKVTFSGAARASYDTTPRGARVMTLLIVLLVAAVILFGIGLGTTLKWLFIVAAILVIVGLVNGVLVGRKSRQ